MKTLLSSSWWSLVIRGVIAILVGLLTFLWPGLTFGSLVLLFGAYALVDGVFNVIGAWRAAEAHERWIPLLIEGFAGIAAAVVTALWPAITALALLYIIAAWSLVTGGFEIAAAIRLRRYIHGEWLLALSGIASIIFGVLLFVFPAAGALAIAIWFGAYAFVFGCLLVALGFRLRSRSGTVDFGSRSAVPSR